jgi:hypothetical protein
MSLAKILAGADVCVEGRGGGAPPRGANECLFSFSLPGVARPAFHPVAHTTELPSLASVFVRPTARASGNTGLRDREREKRREKATRPRAPPPTPRPQPPKTHTHTPLNDQPSQNTKQPTRPAKPCATCITSPRTPWQVSASMAVCDATRGCPPARPSLSLASRTPTRHSPAHPYPAPLLKKKKKKQASCRWLP